MKNMEWVQRNASVYVAVKSVRLQHSGATAAATATPESHYQQNAWHVYSTYLPWEQSQAHSAQCLQKRNHMTRETNKPYCIVAVLLGEPKCTLPVFAYCCCAAHNTAPFFQLETAALGLPAPLTEPSLSLKPRAQYLWRISK